MPAELKILAFDFGASSGRLILGRYDGRKINLEEMHRFSNDPVRLGRTLYWDFPRQFYEVKQALLKTRKYGQMDSLGIDTWGVDFGLIDKQGHLMENPVHYRDLRTHDIIDEVLGIMPLESLYNRTGIQHLYFNTIFQLYAIRKKQPELLERADKMLLMPDLFHYYLTGNKHSEYTIASTGQMLDAFTGQWDLDIFGKLGLPQTLLCPLVNPGSKSGTISADICRELDIKPVSTVAATSHDTASAVVAVPAPHDDFIYISSGTWSLMGIESRKPLINDKSYRYNFTNEGGYNRTIRFLKNIMGLWLIQESRRHWNREGANVSYADLEKEAHDSSPFRSFIDPDDDVLAPPGDIPERIRELCRAGNQPVPRNRGEIVRCIYESLALKYRITKDQIEEITGRKYSCLHVVGGGTKDNMLSRYTANAAGIPVVAGPVEATALGNIAVQLLARGEIGSLDEARQLIGRSFELKTFEPGEQDKWENALEKYRRIYPRLK